jgi:hypothetical protein
MQTDSQQVETDRHQSEHHEQQHPKSHKNFHIEEVSDSYAHQPEPARTNLVHQVQFSGGMENVNGKGHHHDSQGIHQRHQLQKYDVSKYKQLFEEMGAFHVPFDRSMKAIVRHFCKLAKTNDPFYIVDLSHLARQYMQWEKYLPRVKPFYAVKSNPSEYILKTMAKLGANFDCATPIELDLVMKYNIDPATQVVYSHPCKQVEHIKYFRAKGVQLTVIDNLDEMLKLKDYWPEAHILIRIRTDDSHSESPFSTKFGASEKIAERLIQKGKELGMKLVGTSFHVGSSCTDADVYVKSVKSAH